MPPSAERPRAAMPWIIGLLLVAAAAINPLDFITGASEYERATHSTGVQTLLKLAIAAAVTLSGAIGAALSPRTRALFGSVPGVGLLALAGVFCVTSACADAEIRLISIAAGLIFMGYLLFIATAIATIGVKRVIICLTMGTAIYLLFTWGLFVLAPARGQFIEYTSQTESVVRMGGTGHPNMIAKVAVTTGLMALALLTGRANKPPPAGWPAAGTRPRADMPTAVPPASDPLAIATPGPWWAWLWIGVIAISTATVLATFSRTAILAGIAATGMMLIHRLYSRGGLALGIASAASLAALVLAVSLFTNSGPLSESALAAVTKSGEMEEITSLTGRTLIWEEAIGLIAERPLTGWGLDSAATVMSREATGTHSLLLHATFSAGVIAGGLILGLLLWSLFFGVTSPSKWIRGVMVFVLISGLVEDTIFESFPTILTLLWIVALLAPHQNHPPNLLPNLLPNHEQRASSAVGA